MGLRFLVEQPRCVGRVEDEESLLPVGPHTPPALLPKLTMVREYEAHLLFECARGVDGGLFVIAAWGLDEVVLEEHGRAPAGAPPTPSFR